MSDERGRACWKRQFNLRSTILTRQIAPVWEDILGCQILVLNFILGGSKGYCLGIRISISNIPPSYGVPCGPFIFPIRCRVAEPPRSPTATEAVTPEVPSSLQTSESSFVMRVSAADMAAAATINECPLP